MGIAISSNSSSSSTDTASEGEHFSQLVNPGKFRTPSSHDLDTISSSSTAPASQTKKIVIHQKSSILKKIWFESLWNAFLSSALNSFALTPAELQSQFFEIINQSPSENLSKKQESAALENEVKEYISLIAQLSEKDTSKTIDFMAVCSSILFLSDYPIESKIDMLFQWIVLNPESHDFGFEDFAIAICSFERGLSHAMGKVASSEAFIKDVATQWFALADPAHRGNVDPQTRISDTAFFEFCMNRQHVVRKLLESFPTLPVFEDKNTELNEVTDTLDILKKPSSGGDEWMANPAWKKTAEKMVPPQYLSSGYKDSKPSSYLSLDWVHGYRGFDCRNNIAYADSTGERILYHAAALTIVQEQNLQGSKRQIYFGEHKDDITCLVTYRINDKCSLVASGEIGKNPGIYLYLWHSDEGSFQSLATFQGFHTRGIAQIAFSSDGKYLYSVGVDYTVAVYCTERDNKQFGKMVVSTQGPKDRVLHVAFAGESGEGYTFISCGEKHAIVWTFQASRCLLKQENCKFAGGAKNQIFLCCASYNSSQIILSTQTGEFHTFSVGAKSVSQLKLAGDSHEKSAINALHMAGNRLISGDKDGKVIIWTISDTTLTSVYSFKLTGYCLSADAGSLLIEPSKIKGGKGPATPPVRAITISSDGRKILIGTQTCELIEYTLPSGSFLTASNKSESVLARNLVAGHYLDEVWGLAVRPITEQNCSEGIIYATTGDDRMLRIWDLQKHSLLVSLELPCASRSCAFSPDGMYLACGMGAGRKIKDKKAQKESLDGTIRIYRFETAMESNELKVKASVITEIKDAKQAVSAIQFSPDGTLLAVGCRDNCIYLYSVPNQYKRKFKFSKHNAGITQIDFTADGKYLQSNCSAYEILFMDANTGAQLTDGASKLIDTHWHTWTCTLGWAVQGIWSGTMDGTDVNGVDRSPSQRYLASADDFGKVNLFQYPCLSTKGSPHNAYTGHSSHVTSVRWTSIYTRDSSTAFVKPKTDDFLISVGGEDKCVFQWKHSDPAGKEKSVNIEDSSPSAVPETEADDFMGAPAGGDEFTAVKPWLGAIFAPSAWTNKDPQKAPPFFAALGEYNNFLRAFSEEIGGVKSMMELQEKYRNLQQTADNVQQKMRESGVVDPSPPGDELELDWVHGYRGFDVRNNVFYVQPGKSGRLVVYHAAALGILLDPITQEQKYFKGHNDDILSMTIFEPSQGPTFVATGQVGPGNVYVWEVPSLQTLAVLPTKQKTVTQLAFSSDGRLLVSLSQDLSIVISDWKTQSIVTTSKSEAVIQSITVVGGSSSNLQFFTAGSKLLKLWTLQGRNITSSKYVTSTLGGCKIQDFLCVVEAFKKFYVGCEDGSVYVIPLDGKGVKSRFTHMEEEESKDKGKGQAVSAMHVYSTADKVYLFTGGKEGSVVVWDLSEGNVVDKPVRLFSFPVGDLGLADITAKQIQSLYCLRNFNASDGLQILLGTRGCDLLEVKVDMSKKTAELFKSSPMGGILTRGHCNDELWGVDTHPFLPEFCSVGDDKTLRFYELHARRVTSVVPLGHISRTVCYHPSGDLLALGFGGRVGKGKESGGGIVRLYSADWREKGVVKLAERKDAKQWISDVRFTPDGRTLVAAAHDCKIYIYDVLVPAGGKGNYELKLRSTFSKHNSVLNHVDVSADSRYMQSTCSAYELLFCDLQTNKHVSSPSELKDVSWASITCTLGWGVQGIWQGGMDGSDINSVSRSHTGHLLALGNDLGQVQLYRYPACEQKSASVSYAGHSSHVMKVSWSVGDEFLLSTGGGDKTVFQWRHQVADLSPSGATESKAVKRVRLSSFESEGEGAETEDEGGEFEGGPAGGDESGAVKPWLGAVRPPRNPPPISPQPPTVDLCLSWVFGYCSSPPAPISAQPTILSPYTYPNLFYSPQGDVLFPAAALGVVLQRPPASTPSATWSQQHLRGHDEDVLCLAISPNRRFIATGQAASKALKGKGRIVIYGAADYRRLTTLDACHARGLRALAFSPDGGKLLSVGGDDDYTHIVWGDMGGNWSRAQQVATAKGERVPPMFVQWVQKGEGEGASEGDFITGGSKSVSVWKLEGSSLSKKLGRGGKKGPGGAAPASAPSVAYLSMATVTVQGEKKVMLGTSSGDLVLLDKQELNIFIGGAHAGAVNTLCALEGGLLVSGGRDGAVKLWNASIQLISSIELSALSSLHLFSPQVLSIDGQGDADGGLRLLLGTAGGEVIELTVPRSGGKGKDEKVTFDISKASPMTLMSSHYRGELWGLATHPLDTDIFATVGDDSTVRVWSMKRRLCLQAATLPRAGRCVAWHPLGGILAVGLEQDKKAMRKLKKGKGGKKKGKKEEENEDGGDEEGGSSSSLSDVSGGVMVFSFRPPTPSSPAELGMRGIGVFPPTRPLGSYPSVSDLKFSPSGGFLYVAAHDCKLRGYPLPPCTTGDPNLFPWDDMLTSLSGQGGADGVPKGGFVFSKHSSTIVHFDCSVDGLYLQSTDLGNELLFFDLSKLKQEPSATKLADYNGALEDSEEGEGRLWATQTCPFGWAVQGIWPPNSYDSSEINAVDRDPKGRLLATAEDSGKIRVLRYPSVIPNSQAVELFGHSSHVTNVRWALGPSLVSVGGNDKCVFIWDLHEK